MRSTRRLTKHDPDDNGLLLGPRDEAIDDVLTRVPGALEDLGHDELVSVSVVLQPGEEYLRR